MAAMGKGQDLAAEDPKLDVFEDDDEFEEFENEVWDDADEGTGALQQWEDDWDDDDVTDDFSVQLKKEIDAEK
jgi:26 proteasome complex subunit DSS1